MKKLFIPLLCVITVLMFSSIVSAENFSCPVLAYEGELVRLSPAAFDPDPEIGPAGHLIWTFGPPFNEHGQWQTRKGERGIFPFWVSVSDGELTDTIHSCVEVLVNNRNPVVLPMADVYLLRGEYAKFSASCYDPDGDSVSIFYKFNGKDVAYISYEPPGVYDVEAICTDGFGGVGIGKAKLHVLMPPVESKPKPSPVVVLPVSPASAKESKPDVVEVSTHVNDNQSMEPASVCLPCPKDNIDVVVYDGFQDVLDLKNQTTVFVIENNTQAASPAPVPSKVIAQSKTNCERYKERVVKVNKAVGKCCAS